MVMWMTQTLPTDGYLALVAERNPRIHTEGGGDFKTCIYEIYINIRLYITNIKKPYTSLTENYKIL